MEKTTVTAMGVLVLAGMLACSKDEAAAGGGTVTGADGGDSSDAATTAETSDDASSTTCTLMQGQRSTIYGVVRSLGAGGARPLAGVKVCVEDHPEAPCATTASDGTYRHECLPSGDILVRFSLAGYAPTLWARVALPLAEDDLDAVLVRDADNQTMFTPANVTYPRPGHGLVVLNDLGDIDGTTMSAVSAGMEGPFYSADGATIALAATGTVGDGVVFFVAPAGVAEIAIAKPGGGACAQASGGWGGPTPNTVAVPVKEGAETDVFVRCP